MSDNKLQKIAEYTRVDVTTNLERLLFAQAVHELGAGAWVQVSKLLSSHPLIKREPGFFNSDKCPGMYQWLMHHAGLEIPPDNKNSKHPIHLKFAQKYYVARFKELKDQITAEEAEYLKLAKEIDEIRAGKWDDRIRVANGKTIVGAEKARESEEREGRPRALGAPEASSHQNSAAPTTSDSISAEMDISHDDGDESAVEDALLVPDDSIEEPAAGEDEDEQLAIESDAPHAPNKDTTVAVKGAKGAEAKSSGPSTLEEDAVPIDVLASELIGKPVDGEKDEEADDAAEADNVEEDAEEEEEEEDDDTPLAATTSARRGSTASKRKSTPPESGRRAKRARSGSELEDSDAEVSTSRRRTSVSSRTTPSRADADKKRFQTVITMLHTQISQHRSGAIFHLPIREQDAPGYKEVVLHPTDLKTIKGKVRDGTIANSTEYQREIYRMFANAMVFNPPHLEVHQLAAEMMLDCEKHISDFKQTEGFHSRSKGL